MKLLTILGTRPEIIRLCRIIKSLDKLCDQVIIHTGQNYDANLNDIFFQQLGVRKPDYFLHIGGSSFGEQIAKVIAGTEKVILEEKPDKMLVLGDTNSSLAAIVAKRMGVLVYHMEAGNRCFDDRVPEEVNRRIIDHSSDILMPYTERSRANLLKEGIEGNRIYVTGNPILEVINSFEPEIAKSDILSQLGLKANKYFLVTSHREENVDIEHRLSSILEALDRIQKQYKVPVICSLHPRTKNRMEKFGVRLDNKQVQFHAPFAFFDFIALEKNARCVITDSGTVQEETCIFKVPAVTIRDTTERPETIESGSNILAGVIPDLILDSVKVVLNNKSSWTPPAEYLDQNVSSRVVRIVMGYYHNSRAL